MRKILITIVCLLWCLHAVAQSQPPQKEVMHMVFPKGTKRIDVADLDNIIRRKFDVQTLAYYYSHFYKKDDLLIYYSYLRFPPDLRVSMEESQKISLSNMKTDSATERPQIITFGNMRFLIEKYHEGVELYIRFSSDYDKNGRWMGGHIQYLKGDSAKADQYLNDFLPTVGFNN